MATSTPKISLQKPVPNAEADWAFRLNETIDILDDTMLTANVTGDGNVIITDDGSGNVIISGSANFPNLPTASAGLNSGDLWVDIPDNYALRVTP